MTWTRRPQRRQDLLGRLQRLAVRRRHVVDDYVGTGLGQPNCTSARPSPRELPVTKATRPERSIMMVSERLLSVAESVGFRKRRLPAGDCSVPEGVQQSPGGSVCSRPAATSVGWRRTIAGRSCRRHKARSDCGKVGWSGSCIDGGDVVVEVLHGERHRCEQQAAITTAKPAGLERHDFDLSRCPVFALIAGLINGLFQVLQSVAVRRSGSTSNQPLVRRR